MEITRQQSGEVLELRVKGRLDSYWADPLAKRLDEVIREGAHQIRLNLSEVAYLSSAGIRVLVKFYKQLQGIHGSFIVSNPSEPVKTVLELAGLGALLIAQAAPPTVASVTQDRVRQFERGNATFEIFEGAAGTALTCRVIGDPALLLGCRFGEEHYHTVSFPETKFAVGLGAFGNDFTDCRSRFGEFLSIAGAAAYLPTDGTNVPDYMLAAATFIPELQVLYCAMAEGRFSHLARFEATKEMGAAKLTDLIRAGFEIAGSVTIGVVIVAETAGLLEASLRRCPALED